MADPMRRYVAAGVDGSPASLAAAEYAAAWAVRGGLDLHLVHGYLHPFGHGVGLDPFLPVPPPPPTSGAEMLQRVADRLAGGRDGLRIVCRQVAGGPAATLVDESRGAELTVVGSRGHGPLAAVVLGSVAAAVTAHAAGPVIVVRPTVRPPGSGGIVVGVDGSAGAAPALSFGFDSAARFGGTVVALHAWWANPVDTLRHLGEYVPVQVEAAAGHLLANAVRPWQDKYPDVRVVEKLVHSLNPAQELIDESAHAGLVVVGTRGHGGFASLLLGSVSSTVVQHAHCPAAVARAHSHRSA